ncbi:MAG: hypothetical protein CVV42_10670 [Candidatus Riflebacteria bacterium HGW-Riflebacteria-2]|jgi:hypothetical protein|nr:MAG: hypothetical protein CVV42_10670 [Candidatus Riflebacteria bacterium HGW-Riflebacteria-2]
MNKTKEKSQQARVKDAAGKLNQAKRSAAESKERAAPYDVILKTEAAVLVEHGSKELALSEPAQQLTGGEIVSFEGSDQDRALSEKYAHKAKSPTMIDAAASQTRLELADKARCLELALDAVQGIENPTAIEKMLIHQMTAAYQFSMKLMERANDFRFNSVGKIDMDYLNMVLSQATRLMSSYQSGMLALSKSRNGGKQEVIVQHIQVTGDAKAIVSGKMNTLPAGGQGGADDNK